MGSQTSALYMRKKKTKKPLNLLQHNNGYRYSIDALLLADFIQCTANDTWIDLGTGCGIIPIAVAMKQNFKICWAIDIQSDLCMIAHQNLLQYHLLDKIKILEADIRELIYYFPAYRTDFVVSNSPYGNLNSGRLNLNWEKSIARHELFLNLDDIMKTAEYLMKHDGHIYMIYPYQYYALLKKTLANNAFYPEHIRCVTHKNACKPQFVLFKASKKKISVVQEENVSITHNMFI